MKRLLSLTVVALLACSSEPQLSPYEEAKESERKGDVSGAILKYKAILEKEPENIEVHRDYQNLMRKAKRVDEVRSEYAFKAQKDPKAIWIYLNARLMEGAELESEMKRVLAVDSNFVWAHIALSEYYRQQSRWKDGLSHVEFLLAHSTTPLESIRINAGVCYMNLKQDDKAEEQLRLARSEFPASANPLFFLGTLHFNQKKFELAAAELEEALKKDSKYFKAFGLLAQTYHAGGLPDMAASARRRAREFYTKTPEPELAKDFKIVLEIQADWTISIWEKLGVEIDSPVEKGNWIFLGRVVRPDGEVTIQYSMTRTEALKHMIVRSVIKTSTRSNLEPVETYELTEKDDFDGFYRRVAHGSEALRKKYAR